LDPIEFSIENLALAFEDPTSNAHFLKNLALGLKKFQT